MGDDKKTLEDKANGGAARPFRELGPLLFRLLNADDLSLPSARWSLSRLAEVAIGRADAAGAHAKGAALVVGLADPYASSRHALFDSPGGQWHVSDEGSTNGTWLNGARLPAGQRAPLHDGDFIEVGHTAFLHRDGARGPADARDLAPASAEAEPATLCPEWQLELSRLERLAPTAHPILIAGESGAGKEVVAKLLHARSGRKALVSVNCGALAEHLLEDELFGHVRGAFSGAQADRQGLLRAADGGTLFLDEIGDMPLSLQVKLLRVVEEQKIRPVGGDRDLPVDVRVVAATHRDLDALVQQGKFRADLRARLGLLPIAIPPLRERFEDFGLLVRALLRGAGRAPSSVRLTPEALRVLLLHSWPLNVRELRTALLAAADEASTSDGQPALIAPHHLPASVREPRRQAAAPSPPRELSEEDRALRERLLELLRKNGGNVSAVAREMGKGRTQVQRWIARLSIEQE